MAHFLTTVRTDKSADEVFAFMSDLENFAVWDPGVDSAKQVTGDEPGVGAAYEVSASGADLVYTVIEFEPPNRLVAEAKTKLLYSYDVITVEEEDGARYVTYDATLEMSGPLAMGDAALGVLFKKIGDKASAGLETALQGTRIR